LDKLEGRLDALKMGQLAIEQQFATLFERSERNSKVHYKRCSFLTSSLGLPQAGTIGNFPTSGICTKPQCDVSEHPASRNAASPSPF